MNQRIGSVRGLDMKRIKVHVLCDENAEVSEALVQQYGGQGRESYDEYYNECLALIIGEGKGVQYSQKDGPNYVDLLPE
jgi:hypothetical protein